MDLLSPITLITKWAMDFAKPDSSITFPKIAPNKNTGKYSFTNPAIFSIKMPVKKAGTQAGLIKSTANNAVNGAKRITLKPLYAAYINNNNGNMTKIISIFN